MNIKADKEVKISEEELCRRIEELKVPLATELGVMELLKLPYQLEFHQLAEHTLRVKSE